MAKGKTKEQKVYPVASTPNVKIEDHSSDVIGYKGSKQGSMLMRGWHDNHGTFQHEGTEGTWLCIGDKYIVEIGKRRFVIVLQDAIEECLRLARDTE